MPARVSMSTSVSRLNSSIRPRTRLLIRGCVTPKKAAAWRWDSRSVLMNSSRRNARNERNSRETASCLGKPRSSKTLPDDGSISDSATGALLAEARALDEPEPRPGELDVALPRALRALFEGFIDRSIQD